jgi:hypothetical protein
MAPFVHAPLSGPRSPPFAVRRAGGAARSPLAALAADDVRAWPSPSPNTHVLQAPSEAACSAAAGATRKRARASASGSGTRVSKPWAQKAAGLAAALQTARADVGCEEEAQQCPARPGKRRSSSAAPQRQWRLRRSRSNELATSAPSVQRRSSGTRRRQARTTTADGVRQR